MKHSVENALSKRNGIIFFSTQVPLAVKTFFNEDGVIEKQILPTFFGKIIDDEYDSSTIHKLNFSKHGVIIFDIALIIFSIILKNMWFFFSSIYFAIFVSMKLFQFYVVVCETKFKNGAEYTTGRFHGAEHMIINAFNCSGIVPTINKLKTYSRFSNHCSSASSILRLSLSLPMWLTMLLIGNTSPLLCFILAVIFQVIVYILHEFNCLKYLQILLINKPTDRELALAIQALQNLIDEEENVINNGTHFISYTK